MKEYHYTECGLDNIYLLNGFEITQIDNDEEIFIHDIHGLHKAIGIYLVEKKSNLSGNEIKFMRTTMDLTQTRLGNLLGYNYQTILAWEKNKAVITLSADRLLRAMFYEYINPESDRTIFDLINEISDSDAENIPNEKISFEENDEWHLVAA